MINSFKYFRGLYNGRLRLLGETDDGRQMVNLYLNETGLTSHAIALEIDREILSRLLRAAERINDINNS